ncbi:rare lipoprotein A [Saccharicrinis carchari]|uniref:Probable endolytic peptidoglycan transglycosylase RlpA n=1 Tax=Saccharicrinis carchari TaxID=1168039 RepID=A0A521CQD3_SACCC|nr:septal ring lytic transglycosylase RlpA family protein [Saccharicrinis carchari]SMO61618.1 rare lipoprotein A [Saccharicrinis carchari]
MIETGKYNFKLVSLCLLFLLCTVVSHAQIKGEASYYADKFEGRKTASGQIYWHHLKTAAHRTLPFGTLVKVTNIRNKKAVVVVINDRGPFIEGRIIDLSKSAAREVGGLQQGVFEVKIAVLHNRDSLENRRNKKKDR